MAIGFTVDRAALAQTARGINDTINDLKPPGTDETAEVGRGLSGPARFAGSRREAGQAFCGRWSWGVRA